MSVAILGTGPAGMLAAQACALTGTPFSLFGAPDASGHVQPSVITGAQFMHVAIPTLRDENAPEFSITYRKLGDAAGYRNKVYGDDPSVPFVSFDNINDGEVVPAWSLQRLYGELWHAIAGSGRSVNTLKVDAQMLDEWFEKEMWDLVVSTIPRPALCRTHAGMDDRAPHGFMSQEVAIVDDEDYGIPFNTITYNGGPDMSWYRSSNINGNQSTEWRVDNLPPWLKEQAKIIRKPTGHTCDCWAGKPIVFAGRFGKWDKKVLVQDGFIETFQAIVAEEG